MIQGVVDNAIRNRDPRHDLNFIAKIAAKLNSVQHDLVLRADLGHLHSLQAKEQCGGWQAQNVWIWRNVKMDLGKGAGPELAVGVVGEQLDERSPRLFRNRV